MKKSRGARLMRGKKNLLVALTPHLERKRSTWQNHIFFLNIVNKAFFKKTKTVLKDSLFKIEVGEKGVNEQNETFLPLGLTKKERPSCILMMARGSLPSNLS